MAMKTDQKMAKFKAVSGLLTISTYGDTYPCATYDKYHNIM